MKKWDLDDVDLAIIGITIIATIYAILNNAKNETVVIYAMGLIAALARGRLKGMGGIPPKANAY